DQVVAVGTDAARRAGGHDLVRQAGRQGLDAFFGGVLLHEGGGFGGVLGQVLGRGGRAAAGGQSQEGGRGDSGGGGAFSPCEVHNPGPSRRRRFPRHDGRRGSRP